MFESFDFQQMISAFIVLFAVIDIIGSIPIIINLKEKGKDVNAMKATVISFLLMIGFFYAGDVLLRLFHVDIESFAVAGSFVIFLLSLEMTEKRGDSGSVGLSFTGRCRLVYHIVVFEGGVCQCQYSDSFNTEYDMGLFCCSYDSPYRTFFRKRRNLHYPEILRHYSVGYISPLVYRQYQSSGRSTARALKRKL